MSSFSLAFSGTAKPARFGFPTSALRRVIRPPRADGPAACTLTSRKNGMTLIAFSAGERERHEWLHQGLTCQNEDGGAIPSASHRKLFSRLSRQYF